MGKRHGKPGVGIHDVRHKQPRCRPPANPGLRQCAISSTSGGAEKRRSGGVARLPWRIPRPVRIPPLGCKSPEFKRNQHSGTNHPTPQGPNMALFTLVNLTTPHRNTKPGTNTLHICAMRFPSRPPPQNNIPCQQAYPRVRRILLEFAAKKEAKRPSAPVPICSALPLMRTAKNVGDRPKRANK